VVVLGTDGLFDNLTEKQIIDEISKLKVISKDGCIILGRTRVAYLTVISCSTELS
jgi:serine/threonine protein phosphatase PrpC